MTGSPDPGNQPQSNYSRRFWFVLLSRTSIALGVILLVGIVGGAWWVWIFINQRLAPLVETNLQQLLGRPVQVGKVEDFSLNSLRFGPSSVPATPTDPDNLKAEAVQVQFDPWQLLLQRTLKLNVRLIQPNVYIEQDKQGRWLTTEIKASPEEKPGFIQTELNSIQVENGDVVLQPTSQPNKPKAVVGFNQVNGLARFLERNQLITFRFNSQPARGGDLQITGNTRPNAGQANLKINASNLLASDLSRLVASPVDIQGGRVDSNLTIQLQPTQPDIALFGTVGLNQIIAQIPNSPSKITNTTGKINFQGQKIDLKNITARYGSVPIQAQGTINTQTGYNLKAEVKPVNLKNVVDSFKVNLPVPVAGAVQANFNVQGALQKPVVTGTVNTVKTAQIDRLIFNNISTGLRLTPNELVFANIQASPNVGGKITGSGRVGLGNQNRIAVNLQGQNLPGDAIAKTYNASPGIQIGSVSANTQISGVPNNLQTVVQLQAPAATYPAQLQAAIDTNQGIVRLQDAVAKVAGGTVTARGQLIQKRWQGVVAANGIQLSRFPQVPPQYRGVVNGEFNVSGTTDSFQLADIQATGQANLRVADGTVNLRNIRLDEGRWQTLANISQVQLNTLSEQLRGRLNGEVRIAGTTESFQLVNIQAAGQVRLSQGLAQLQQPLTAQFNWNGEQLRIIQATAPGLRAAGTVAVQTQETPQVTGFNLDVTARDYNLQNLPFQLPGNVAVAGTVDFTGKATGTPTTPVASGNIQLENFAVNDLAFDPVLTGQVNYQPEQGTQLQLTGKQDRITFNLDPNNRPTSFLIRRDGSVATGRTEGDNLLVNVREFPVAALRSFLPANANLRPVTGELSGNLTINLEEFNVIGDVAIAQPRIGRITGDEFRGRVGFADGTFSLQQGELRQGQSRYLLSGELPTTGQQPLQFQLSLDQGRIENILQALNIFGFEDLATGLEPPDFAGAEALQTKPVSLPDAPLLTQLDYFSKILDRVAQQQTQQQQQQARIPTLAELSGPIDGQIAVTGSLQTGLNASFNFTGSDWVWGDYKIDEVIANGNFEDGVFRLLPLRVNLDGSLLAFAGQLSQQQLSGQARVEAFPVELIEPFLPNLPVEIAGRLNALVTLAGSLNNPSAIGEIALVNGSINNQSVENAQVSLNYNNARLNFGSTVSVAGTGTEPVQITGSIPLALPFAQVEPDNNQIDIQANVQDEGLAILNAFTDQVNWVKGQGQVNLQIQGTLDQPSTNGIAKVENATFKAQNLSEPVTNVTGTVRFEGDRFIVTGLQGKYSQGQLTAAGILPIFATQNALQQAATNPLTVMLENLRLSLPQLYEGGVSGNVTIRGTVQAPQLGGNVRLKQGEIFLGENPAASTTTGATPPADAVTNGEVSLQKPTVVSPTNNTAPAADSPTPPNQTLVNLPVEFADFQVILEDNVRVTQQPLFSFVAKGDVTLNGTLANPRPQGVISLQRGQVNLFVTQFTLAHGYEQTATFTPKQGFDPNLDVRLVTFIPETRGSRLPTTPFSSEISDTSANTLGTFKTVRIQASVDGPASKISENLELTSEPARTQEEIVALLGGSFLNVFGQADPTSIGIATLTSSPFFSAFQGAVSQFAETIGLRSFQVFPTIETNARGDASVLSLAAEAAIAISNNASFSVSRVFYANESFRYNLLYELNDQFILRGSTNLSDESRGEIQFETRF
ncbi:MAG: translocation/assembly module TamB domain-containing protein [Fischerella sp.]|uniref:translocation/assembly module TamB domain-containing protein n=1 Tax=Fischerella sp. TaxID=1191 RepID=UPI00179EC498|nr:translocation/assembly module TamB domain-containing protein [Fischerella sp.]NWF58293.1 translocation/assembly module TamB domain-containing protein [Fischerella sp.]